MRRKSNTDFFSIESDITEPINMLNDLGARKKTMMRRLLSGIGTDAKNKVKKGYKSSGLKKRSGTLYKSISKRVIRSGKAVIIEAKAQAENNVFYGYALSKGSEIRAKDGGYLTFQIDGKWKKVHSVKLPERNFVEKPVNDYLKSTAYKEKLDKLVQKEIAKIEKKNENRNSSSRKT